MYCNVSNMLIVLFAVAFILPAFQGEGFLSGTEEDFSCWRNVDPAGTILCQLHGSKGSTGYRPRKCQVTCHDPTQTLTLNKRLCPSGKEPCSETIKEGISIWKEDMMKTKNSLIHDWCPSEQGK